MLSWLRKHRLLLTSGLAVLAIGIFGLSQVPLYDGIGFPDEPYRYVVQPDGSTNPTNPPTTIDEKSLAVRNNTNEDITLASGEQGPQVSLYLGVNSLQIPPSGSSSYEIKIEPVAPTVQPSGGQIAGNVYRFSATSDAGTVTFASDTNKVLSVIALRLPQGVSGVPILQYRVGDGAWRKLETRLVGQDVYQAVTVGFGDYALTEQKSIAAQIVNSSSHLILYLGEGILAFLAISAILAFLIRRNTKSSSKQTRAEK